MRSLRLCATVVFVAGVPGCDAGQRADPDFRPLIREPTYAEGAGPVIWIDEGHHNVVATTGRYGPLVAALQADGYVVKPFRAEFAPASLGMVRLLVIGNALHPNNVNDWSLPAPSAFAPREVRAIHEWVRQGGALLLLVDHMPFPGAAAELAAMFGVEFLNGYVQNPQTWDPIVFRRIDGTLVSHPVTNGLDPLDRVSYVRRIRIQGSCG